MKNRILFLGQKNIGTHALRTLLKFQENLIVTAVVTNVQPTGWWNNNDVACLSFENEIMTLDNQDRHEKELIHLIHQKEIDTIISVQHPWILSKELIDSVDGRAFNLHLARLPEYRGWNACSHAIINGDAKFGVTLHWLAEKLDYGNIVYLEEFDITPRDTAQSLYLKAQELGEKLFEQFCKELDSGRALNSSPMLGQGKFYSRHSLDQFRNINSSTSFSQAVMLARALHFPPYESLMIRDAENDFHVEVDFPDFKIQHNSREHYSERGTT